jgi:DNA-binding GntR family transcriptional regulator
MAGAAAPSTVASRRIADQVRERILDGRLAPGTRIIQDEIADELSASRLPVREALRMLESAGLVTLKANSGAWVSSMTLRDCELSYRMREKLEPLLLSESLPHLTATDVEELGQVQAQIEADDDVERFLVLDRQFHWITYRRHDAEELARIVGRLWDTTQHYRRAFTRLTGADRRWIIHAEHRLLVDAVRSGDLTSAMEQLETHIRRTRVELVHHPEVFQTDASG